ncbi:unnamed protein product [Rhizoctonia solani]|uniref:Uncharacterized protein n=1 Tax=Rhizoctonia solani TaxID=456999 RepID=A0A8H3BZE0_9AGAM|nr:unnamed protein product [Rhizoctonia solani]
MAFLHPGRYRLRALTEQHSELLLGGMYATATVPGAPVQVAADSPSFVGQQMWDVLPASEEGRNTVVIRAARSDDPRMSFWHNQSEEQEAPGSVILEFARSFNLESFKSEDSVEIFFISPADAPHRIGATCYVGTDDNNCVITKWYPVVPGMDRPVWAFCPPE